MSPFVKLNKGKTNMQLLVKHNKLITNSSYSWSGVKYHFRPPVTKSREPIRKPLRGKD